MWKSISKWLLLIIPLGLLVLLFSLKGELEEYVSNMMVSRIESGSARITETKIDSLYNYKINGLEYQVTFLEFGAKGCVACRKMEYVMEEIRMAYPGHVQVVFLNIVHAESQDLMRYFGVVAIPTQILLDHEGKAFFRHTGFISTKEIEREIKSRLATALGLARTKPGLAEPGLPNY